MIDWPSINVKRGRKFRERSNFEVINGPLRPERYYKYQNTINFFLPLSTNRWTRRSFWSTLPESSKVLRLIVFTGSFLFTAHTNTLHFPASFSHFYHARTSVVLTVDQLADSVTLFKIWRITMKTLEWKLKKNQIHFLKSSTKADSTRLQKFRFRFVFSNPAFELFSYT